MNVRSRFVKSTLLAAVISLGPITSSACEAEWRAFVNEPSQSTYQALARSIPKCNEQGGLGNAEQRNRVVLRLEHLIEARNTYAIDVGFQSLKLLDGGNLEDITRALGLITESHPVLFLRSVKKYRLTDIQFQRLLLAFPESTIDHQDLRVLRARERLKRITIVKDAELADLKKRAANILRQFLVEQE